MVALLIFALGAGVSIYQGVVHILHPEPIDNFRVSYLVLGLSFVFEGTSWWIAVRAFRKQRGTLGFIEAATRSRDPTSYLVLFEDSAALAGIAIAVAGTLEVVAQRLERRIRQANPDVTMLFISPKNASATETDITA